MKKTGPVVSVLAAFILSSCTAPPPQRDPFASFKMSSTPQGGTKIFVSDVDTPSYKAKENPDNFALVIGIEKYMGIPDAQFAERDAATMLQHLIALGYPERNIIHLSGNQAGRAGMEKYVESWLPLNVNERSRVFFYFSGHGAPGVTSREAYLVPWDGDMQFLENTGYSVKKLYKQLESLKAKEVLVAMDSCFSGAGGRSVIAKGMRPLVMKVDTGLSEDSKLLVFSASGPEEITGTDEAQGHGLFTYYFLKALNDGKGKFSVNEVYDYLVPKVRNAARRQNRDQSPRLLPVKLGKKGKLHLDR
ncbi:MAG: caspase family protein [Elusimicrobiota bacterium]